MSKIGRQPIKVPDGVTATIESKNIVVKGKLGEVTVHRLRNVKIELDESKKELRVILDGSSKQARSNWGTERALLQNAVLGVTNGFEKTLILEGVGYRINKEGEDLTMNIKFSHPVYYKARPGITFEIEKNSILKIRGVDKNLVGQVAAEIRALEKAEPYKGKGFRYADEIVRRKAGKKAAATTGSA